MLINAIPCREIVVSIGLDTAVVRTEYNFSNKINITTYEVTPLSRSLQKYIGPLPEEKHWTLAFAHSEACIADGEVAFWAFAKDFPYGNNVEGLRKWPNGLNNVSVNAKRKILHEIMNSPPQYKGMGCRRYYIRVQEAIELLDRQAEPDDIPTMEEVFNANLWKTKWAPRLQKLRDRSPMEHNHPQEARHD